MSICDDFGENFWKPRRKNPNIIIVKLRVKSQSQSQNQAQS